jgi:uncharacterized C2H2 Zn-finger protein
VTDKLIFTCPENCGYSTKSEAQFVKHLIDAHAVRPNQVPRILARIEKQAAKKAGQQ